MKKSFLVIGLGRFGYNIAKTLSDLDLQVLAIDIKEENVNKIASFIPQCAIADSTKKDVLEELNVSNIDHAVIAIGNNLKSTVLTIINLKNLGVNKITVRADEESHKEIYKMLGATEVILPEEASAISLANQMSSDSILDYYELENDYVMVKVVVGEKFESQSLIDLNVRNRFDVNIVGVINNGKFIIPRGPDKLHPGNILVVVGTKNKIKKFDNYLNE